MEFCVHENLWRFRERARRSRNCSGIDENRDPTAAVARSEEHTSELQSPCNLVCRLLLEKKKVCQEYLRIDVEDAAGPWRDALLDDGRPHAFDVVAAIVRAGALALVCSATRTYPLSAPVH